MGIDIGSSTSHFVYSRLTMERTGSRYKVVSRELLYESDVMLTPFVNVNGVPSIDGEALVRFLDEQCAKASIEWAAVDTGAIILTGLASRRQNAYTIGRHLADRAGRFVSVSAGDALEARLAAHGSGAVDLSTSGESFLNIDIGGGTVKLALCKDGEVQGVTALDVGARLILRDDENVVTRVEPEASHFAEVTGLPLEIGARLSDSDLNPLVDTMTSYVVQVATKGNGIAPEIGPVLRLPPLANGERIAGVVCSGGVSEYLSTQNVPSFGDLGQLLASSLSRRLSAAALPVHSSGAGLRATVMGASQHTVQLSGSTIFCSDFSLLPMSNVAVLVPNSTDDVAGLAPEVLARRIGKIAGERAGEFRSGPVALCFQWRGSATLSNLENFASGLQAGLAGVIRPSQPVVIVTGGDVGGTIGMHLNESDSFPHPVISIDGVELRDLDYIDVGEMVPSSGALPVVVKSLIFPGLQA